MATATLNSNTVTDARVDIPKWGVWYAEVTLDREVTITGAVTLVIADLALKGTVMSGGPEKGRSRYRIAGGKGGWGKTLKENAYANDAGVKTSTLLIDVASAAGEDLDTSTLDRAIAGSHTARPRGRASQVLHRNAPQNWYVGEDGVTRIGSRAVKDYNGTAARVQPASKAYGSVVLAADSIATLVPGARVDGIEAVDVKHEISAASGLRTTIYGKHSDSETTRRIAAYKAIIDALDPNRAFGAVYEYRVVTLSSKRVNLQPVLVSTGMPDLQRVPYRPGVSGAYSEVLPGARVVVGFLNRNAAQPVVLAVEDPDGEGFTPLNTKLEASVDVDIFAPSVRLGSALAVPLTLGPQNALALGAINTAVGVISSTMQNMTSGYTSLSSGQKSTFTGAISTLQAALTAAVTATLALQVKGS